MKTLVTVIFNSEGEAWNSLRSLFERCGLENYAAKGPDPVDVYIVKLEEGSDRLECLVEGLKVLGLSWNFNRENVYSDAELRAAPLLRVVIDRAPKGMGGPADGTEYDLSSGCPNCGTGARQVSPLVLNEGEIPKRAPIFETLSGEKLISEDLKQKIEPIHPRGLELWEAIGRKRRQGLGYFQLLAEHELPPMDPSTEGLLRDAPCSVCGRDGHFESMEDPLRIRYHSENRDAIDLDAYITYEWFGNSKLRTPFEESQLAHPLLLISPRIYAVLVEARVRGLKFEPISVG